MATFLQYYWWRLPTDCAGHPYGPPDHVLTEALLELADDFLTFATAMAAVGFLLVASAGLSLVRPRSPARLTASTFVTTVLAILLWSEFGQRIGFTFDPVLARTNWHG